MILNHKSVALAALMLLAAGPGLSAQENLTQEITVRHHEEVKPTDAVKINASPVVTMPPLQASRLTYGMRQIRVGVPASISSLSPAAYGDTIYVSPYKGYASLGYLPMLNLGASAGYKFIDNDRVRLNGWLQYDGTSYRGDLPWQPADVADKESVRLRRNFVTLGSALHTAVGRQSFIDMGLDYTFARFNTPSCDGMDNQNVHRFNLQGLWTINTGKWNGGAGLSYGHFAYGNLINMDASYFTESADQTPVEDWPALVDKAKRPVREDRITAHAFVAGKVLGAEAAGLSVNFSYLTYGRNSAVAVLPGTDWADGGMALRPLGSFSHGLLSFRPYYRTTWNHIDLDLGANLEVTVNNGRVFHISPSAQATWKPADLVAVYVKANGGERQNTLGSLFDVTYYSIPNVAYNNSHVPLNGEVGVTIGMFRGFYAELAAGYAIANDWLMPLMPDPQTTMFSPVDMKGYKLHIALGYRYRNLAEASISFERAPQKVDRGFFLWRDRAKNVAEANLRVSPISSLDINIGWTYRGGRMTGTGTGELMPLGNVNALSVGGIYRITPQWSAFANVENILNHRFTLIGGLPSQGVGGLAGVSYKF